MIPYLTARGITSVALLARVAATQEALEAGLATPFITGWQASGGTNFQANAGDALLVQAALTVAREDARVARARALAPVTTEPAPAASPQQVAERPDRVPTTFPGQWSPLVDAYNNKFAPSIRAFPEERLMGAESVIARMLYELKTSRYFTYPAQAGWDHRQARFQRRRRPEPHRAGAGAFVHRHAHRHCMTGRSRM